MKKSNNARIECIKLVTIQHLNVLKRLNQNKTYFADFSKAAPNLQGPYRSMAKYYGWKTCPVFCDLKDNPSNHKVYILNDRDDFVALWLKIPKNMVKIQYFYDWTDFVYFTEFPDEFNDVFNTDIVKDLETFGSYVFECKDQGSYDVFQATIPYIKPEWLMKSSNNIDEVLKTVSD